MLYQLITLFDMKLTGQQWFNIDYLRSSVDLLEYPLWWCR